MVAISFKPEWRDKLLRGEKTQTIRPRPSKKRLNQLWRTNPAYIRCYNKKPLDLHIYTAQRTRNAELLFKTKTTGIYECRFNDYGLIIQFNWFSPEINENLQQIAKKDGFQGLHTLRAWFETQYGPELEEKDFILIRFESPIKEHPGLGEKLTLQEEVE